jgi:hypothetical protein
MLVHVFDHQHATGSSLRWSTIRERVRLSAMRAPKASMCKSCTSISTTWPELDGEQPEPLCDSRWDFAEQCRRLIASKNYDIDESP